MSWEAAADLARPAAALTGLAGAHVAVWLPFGLVGVISWAVWSARRFLAFLYRPLEGDFWDDVSVVAPAFREDPEILIVAARSWLYSGAAEVVIVLPADERASTAEAIAELTDDPRVRLIVTDNPAKRNSLTLAIEAAQHPIVVLTDSDTLWEPDLLKNLLIPFEDPGVGGVGTRQRVLEAESSVWRRAADWMLDARYQVYVPAMARKGGVSCLSGRTVAYRHDVLQTVLPGLLGETFWGRRCVSGDDGRLTWLVLNEGYKTTYQHNAVAWTMMPDTATGFLQQRVRWARNSYRCYLRAIFRGWLFRQPMITRVSVLQGLLAPLSLTVSLAFVALAAARGDFVAVAGWTAWVTAGRGLRAFDHLRSNPRNLLLLPMMTGLIVFVLTAVKYVTFATMNKQAWITRTEDRGTAEGQGHESIDLALLRSRISATGQREAAGA